MSILNDPGYQRLERGGVRTKFKTRDSVRPTYKHESFPRPNKLGNSKNSSDNSKKRGLGAYWYW